MPRSLQKGKRRQRSSRRRSSAWNYVIGISAAVAVVGVLIAVAVLTQGDDGGGGGEVILPKPRPEGLEEHGRVLGPIDAPVTIIEYADFQCPFCRRVATSVLPTIEEEFILSGQAKLEMRPIAILGEESVLAAQAAECANDQGRFWDYHDTLYANQGRENSGAFSRENLKRFAKTLGLDMQAFEACMDSDNYASKVMNDTQVARRQGINKTPTILVNGREVGSGLDALTKAILQELASGS